MKWNQSELFGLIKSLKGGDPPDEADIEYSSPAPDEHAPVPHTPQRNLPEFRPPVVPQRAVNPAVVPPPQARTNFTTLYNKNMDEINRCIHVAGNAISTLDTIEARLYETRNYVANLIESNIGINEQKAHEFVLMFAEQVNALISTLDHEEPNMLRDSRVQIRFVELGGSQTVNGIDLTLISIEKLIAFKLQNSNGTPHDWLAFFDTMSGIVKNNVQIISSIMLALIASREYTANISEFAMRENIIGARPPEGAAPRISSSKAERFYPSRTSEITRNMPPPYPDTDED